MNYYDELGVRRDASEREIRQAYRVLVRLLHPDAQTSDPLCQAAERQLNRLNEMLALLTNVETRRAYDLALDRDSSPRCPAVTTRTMAGRAMGVSRWPEGISLAQFALKYWAAILIGVVIVSAAGLSVLLHGNSESVEERRAIETQPAARPSMVTTTVARAPKAQPPLAGRGASADPAPQLILEARPSEAPGEKVRSVETSVTTETLPATLAGSLPSGGNPEPMTETKAPVDQGLTLAQPAPLPAPESSYSFSGNWLYTADLSPAHEGDGYRAIYVELFLSEVEGALSGDYRARYVVPDKAISPHVSFHLQGRAGSERNAHLGWAAANGARGEAELSLSAPGIMDIRWWTVKLSEQSGLSSGTARLVRRRTP